MLRSHYTFELTNCLLYKEVYKKGKKIVLLVAL